MLWAVDRPAWSARQPHQARRIPSKQHQIVVDPNRASAPPPFLFVVVEFTWMPPPAAPRRALPVICVWIQEEKWVDRMERIKQRQPIQPSKNAGQETSFILMDDDTSNGFFLRAFLLRGNSKLHSPQQAFRPI